MADPQVDYAFNSMLRTDYIALRDTAKLSQLAEYYVDYYGFLRQILSESDQLIIHSLPTGTQSGSCDPVLKRVCG
jgi:hypothetical protein